MECACIDMDIDDPVEILSDKMVVARKDHKCAECCETIPKGTTYRNETFIYEGMGYHKTCLVCDSVRSKMFCSFKYGEIWERLREEILESDGSMAWSHIAGLIPAARVKVCDLIEEYWYEEYGEET